MPVRTKNNNWWFEDNEIGIDGAWIEVPSDFDEKLIGRHLSWNDEPVEIC